VSTTDDGANLDASTIDLDQWIDEVVRPEVTVELYPYEADYARRVAEIEAKIPAAEASTPETRGIDDPSIEALSAQLADLREERSRTAKRVRLRQLTDADFVDVAVRFKAAKIPEGDRLLWNVAACTVAPDYDGPLDGLDVPQHFTHVQLKRLMKRDRSGAAMVAQLVVAINGLTAGLPVPSLPAS